MDTNQLLVLPNHNRAMARWKIKVLVNSYIPVKIMSNKSFEAGAYLFSKAHHNICHHHRPGLLGVNETFDFLI